MREAGEGAEGGSGVSVEAFGEEKRKFVEGLGLELREPILEIAPQPLDGIQLRRIRGKEQEGHIFGQAERLGFVKGAIIEQEEMETDGVGGSEVVEEEVKALGVEGGQFQKEALARQGFDRPVEVEALEAIG